MCLALQQKEVDGVGSNGWSDIKTDFCDQLDRKQLRPIIQVGAEKEPDLPDVPLLNDLAKTPEDRQVLEFITKSNTSIGKPFATSPGVPARRIAALRKAFDTTMTDPGFTAEADKLKVEIRPIRSCQMASSLRRRADRPSALLLLDQADFRAHDWLVCGRDVFT